MRPVRLALLPTLAIVAAACSPGSPGATGPAPTGSTPTAAPTVVATQAPTTGAASPAPATRVEVKLTDTLRIEPAVMTVPAGVPVTFVVTNAGVLEHEFYLGDEAAQAEHEKEMQSMGGMTHDEPEGIAVAPGATKELTYTFASPGETLAGCHVQGHYLAGMKATINVEG